MSNEGPFTRVAVLVTAFKRTPSDRTQPVRGCFRQVRGAELAFRADDPRSPVAGRLEIDLGSFMTDAPERDTNVITHLFGPMRVVTATIDPAGQILRAVGDDSWSWRGFVELSVGARVPVVLVIRRRRLEGRVEVTARLARPIDLSVSALGFAFAAFASAVGMSTIVDRVEIDAGIAFDESATRPRARIVIAGGGIAGLAAAQSLVDAGCDVTIVEKERFCGGKLTSRVDEALGHTVEHGIHAVFPRYENLLALWAEAGIGETVFADTKSVGVASPRGMTSGRFRELAGDAPMFLRRMIPGGLLRARDLAASAAFLARVYGASADRDALDNETFQALLDRYGVSERMQRFVMHPYVRNLSYARTDQVSAAAACDALGYYLLENADNFKARWLDGGPQELIIEPWVAELAKRGVRFLTNTPVKFVLFEGGRFHGFATRAVIPARRLGTQDRCWTQRFGSRVLALRWQPARGELHAWDGLCTHAGCPLQPAGEHGCDGFRCDCHGGAFDVEGRVVRAPPKQDLTRLPVVSEEIAGETFWKIALDDDSDADGVLTADYGVVALDIEGARHVLTPALLDLPSTRGIAAMRTTPLMVLRMWFRGTSFVGPESGFFEASDMLDNFFVLSRFQREFRDVDGFTVVECHIGDCASVEVREDEEVLHEAARCLERYFPALGPAALDIGRSRVLRHREGFSLFSPGDATRAPSVAADDRQNLFFAGDWVRSEVRSWYMERAAVTGIEAANHVLTRERHPTRAIRATDQSSIVPKLIGLPFRASDAIGRAYRAVVDHDDESATQARGHREREVAPSAPPFTPPFIDLAELLPRADLARVHPSVRAFYEDPTRFDLTGRLPMTPLAEQLARRGLPMSPLAALGLVGARDNPRRCKYPIRMRVQHDGHGQFRWDRWLVIDDAELPLASSRISVSGGYLRESFDSHGRRVEVSFHARSDGDGVRFELVRATPAWLFTAVRLSCQTHPTRHGVRSVGAYDHRLLRLRGEIELDAALRTSEEHGRAPAPAAHVAAASEVRLRASSTPPETDTVRGRKTS